MWISVLWHSRFHCPGIVLLGTQKYDIEAYTGTILNFFCQIFIKSNNQGQFRNPQDELISKLSLLARFDKDLAEILEVEEKASISE